MSVGFTGTNRATIVILFALTRGDLIPGVKIVGAATLNDLVLENDATQWF